MFRLFKNKKIEGTTLELKIRGMHCSSCSMNIDGELEDTLGVISATTSYAKAQTVVEFVPSIVSRDDLKKVIENLDYTVQS